ncbi:MAG: methyltransferase domain-containing protein [Lachnospiraceae bacterium]|nr:methyltransferase domain-containing protein [Lachnospiraceae bacterium]
MLDVDIKEYLSRVGIRKITELDTALIETFGQNEGERHVERLTELFDLSEERLVCGTGDTPYLHRQQELVDYLNQSQQMSLLASSFYDRVFFRRVMEYLLRYDSFWSGDIFDIGCGNGILTCFLALRHSDSAVTGLELSPNAVSVAKELAERLQINNVQFTSQEASVKKQCDTLFSCRTVHENVAWRALREEPEPAALPAEEHAKRHGAYARELAALVKAQGYLVSVERYGEDSAYAGMICALERAGLRPVRGTHMQFSCKDGDKTAVFQAMIFQKA